jgi:tetratricopeptide (TPR) repeat protein
MESIGKMLEATLSHFEKKEYAEAEQVVDKLLKAHPDFHQAQFLKAVILEEQGRADAAAPHYQRSGNPNALWPRLASQLEHADPERAIRYYERSRKADPANNIVLFRLGTLYEQRNQPDKARECWLQLSPAKEVMSRIFIPLGFLVIIAGGAIAMFRRGDFAFASVVSASALFCVYWLKRDGGRTLAMVRKKKSVS